ncbi:MULTISPECIES: DUF2218 domain-containing protein [unclassified Luteimonas]|uniref:DUF2218 domain-containing protein n=1 Tax=Lysobacteraceae TaxID=32033 RepID=UPI00100B799D|nr:MULTISPECIES: DUF2218 domain-containing protein [unclassified Luteimonas]MCD9047350.1 DUF2218 domain-containing protein [Luteimonas sp. MHLX1A]
MSQTTSTAVIASPDAARLLRTLCNHWRHKFEIRRDHDGHAHVPFTADGGADFDVDGERLRIRLQHPDADERARLQRVIENHLRRFERDETLAFDWSPDGGA